MATRYRGSELFDNQSVTVEAKRCGSRGQSGKRSVTDSDNGFPSLFILYNFIPQENHNFNGRLALIWGTCVRDRILSDPRSE